MTPAEILTIINIVNGLINFAKEVPAMKQRLVQLLDTIDPHIEQAGAECAAKFEAVAAALNAIGVPPVAPAGNDTPVPHDPQLAALRSDRDAAHATATAAQARADDATRVAQANSKQTAQAVADRDALATRMQQIATENETLKGQLGASEVARQKAERAAQDTQVSLQHVQAALAASREAAQKAARK